MPGSSQAPLSGARLAAVVSCVLVTLIAPRAIINYGESGDSIDNAGDARKLLTHGLWSSIPEMIRWPPGIPLFIYVQTPFVAFGHVATNAVVVSFYVLAVVAFRRLAALAGAPPLATVILALTPILVKNAAVTQDFVCGVACLLVAAVCLYRQQFWAAGLVFGLAIGFRFTNVLMLIPASAFVLLSERGHPAAPLRLARVVLTAVAVAAVLYAPFVITSGNGWRYFVPLPGHGGGLPFVLHVQVVVYNLLYVMGPLAVLAIAVGMFVERDAVRENVVRSLRAADPGFWFAALTIAIHAALAWRFTMKPEYVLPAVPFVLLLAAKWFRPRMLAAVGVAVVSFNFVSIEFKGGDSGRRSLTVKPAAGLVVSDWIRRTNIQSLRDGVPHLQNLGKAVVLTGMMGILVDGNDAVVPSRLDEIDPGLPKEWGDSEHRAVGTGVFRLKGPADVFLVTSLPRPALEIVRRAGYKIVMFAEYAPSEAVHGRGYDPYAEGIPVIEVFGANAFYRSGEL